jgi:hypothetical protein
VQEQAIKVQKAKTHRPSRASMAGGGRGALLVLGFLRGFYTFALASVLE